MARNRSIVVERVSELWYGRDPEGVAQSDALHVIAAGNVNGRDGTVHYGMKGEPVNSYTGLVASPQNFIGAAQMGSAKHVPIQEYAALPSARSPQGLATFVDPFDGPAGLIP